MVELLHTVPGSVISAPAVIAVAAGRRSQASEPGGRNGTAVRAVVMPYPLGVASVLILQARERLR